MSVHFLSRIRRVTHTFSPTEQVLFWIFSIALLWSLVGVVVDASSKIMVPIPRPGGEFTEGIVGYPRFINPLFALSDADRDMTALVYSGLLAYEPDGTLIPDLAQSYTISADKLQYTFTLKPDITFHDGTPITADDILFTIQRAKDPAIKSPKRANWEGVTVEKRSDRDIVFSLRQPFPAFLENTTLGILPSHLWKPIDPEQFIFSDLNILPVGSGSYRIDAISRDQSGRPRTYTLKSYDAYALGMPYIKTLTLSFYANEESLLTALSAGDIDAVNAITPTEARALSVSNTTLAIKHVPLPRIFSVFFNQNKNAGLFANKEVRVALNNIIDRDAIIEKVFSGYATPVDSPLPPNVRLKVDASVTASSSPLWTIDQAKQSLEKAGWKKNKDGIYEKTVKKQKHLLQFSLSVPSVPELKATAELLAAMWQSIGADVTLKFFDPNDFSQNVLRPREYEALLFGEIVGRDIDLFAFWHSSQRNDPGLNIALYTNIKADKLLSEARTIDNPTDRLIRYTKFEDEIKKDIPAIFLYSPDFIYIIDTKVGGVSLGRITTPAERFLGIRDWYTDTDRVWESLQKIGNRTIGAPWRQLIENIRQ